MVEKTEKAVFHPEKNNTLKISPFFDWKKNNFDIRGGRNRNLLIKNKLIITY